MAYPEINTILRQTINEVTTIHNSAPTIQTIISKDSPTITTIVNGFWDAVWSVNGQTGDVRIEFTFDPFKPNTVYLQNQAIVHNDNIYIARESFTSGNTFNEADWNIIGDMANADMVTYNNTETGISATTVQEALDYIIGEVPEEFNSLDETVADEGTVLTLEKTANTPFKKLLLKGDTEQDGTPTPDAPVDIQTVTGEQTVKICRKNLLPIVPQSGSGITITYDSDTGETHVSGTATAEWIAATLYVGISIPQGTAVSGHAEKTYIASPHPSSTVCRLRDATNDATDDLQMSSAGSTKIMSKDITRMQIWYHLAIGTTYDFIDRLQLEYGSTATTFEPYQGQSYPINLGSLELAKIGDYQDYLWTDGEKWYKHKTIAKSVLDGTQDFTTHTTANNFYRNGVVTDALVGNYGITYAVSDRQAVAQIIDMTTFYNAYHGLDYAFAIKYGTLGIAIRDIRFTTHTELEEWFAQHQATIYYVLATPTDEEIQEMGLIEQLNVFHNARSYDPLTNISSMSVSPNLPAVLDVEAFQKGWVGYTAGIGKLSDDVRDDLREIGNVLRSIDNNSVAAHNSIVRGKDLTNVYTLDELSAKLQVGDFSDIYVGDYITKKVTVGSGTERELDFVIAHIDYFMHVGDTETTRHHLVMVPDTAFYEYMQMNDTNTTTGGYYGSKGHGICNAVYSAGTGGALTSVVADYTTFQATTLGAAEGTFVFTRTSDGWQYDGTVVSTGNLSTYGITYSGTPVVGDVITISYVPGYLEPYRQAIYTAFGNDHVLAHRTQYSTSTSTNAWHTNRCELMNESMVYGQIVRANNTYGELTENSQLAWFSARPDKRVAMRGKGSTSRTNAWLSSINSGSNFCNVNNNGDANYNGASNSNAVRPYFLFA